MDSLLNQAKAKVDRAELYRLERQTTPLAFRTGQLESIHTKQIGGYALRVVWNGHLGYATTTDSAQPEALLDAAMDAAAFGERVSLALPGPRADRGARRYDEDLASAPMEELVALGEQVVAGLESGAPEAETGVFVTRGIDRVSIENTSGLNVSEDRASIEVSVEVSCAQEDDIFIVADSIHARSLATLEADRLVDRVLRNLRWGETLVPAPSGKMPVVFTPRGAIAVLFPLVFGYSGRSVYLGTSPLKGKLGEVMFDPRVSLVDDGTVVDGLGGGGFDDEGVPTRRTPLIAGGEVAGFYYDLRTAELAGVGSTGNGFKGGMLGGADFRALPSASVSNLLLLPGEATLDELIEEVGDGLLVDTVLGLGQGNLSSGDFSNNVAVAYKIERGRIIGRVKNAMLAGNTYRLLNDRVVGIGDCPEWIFGRLFVPPLALSEVNVAAK